MKFSILLVGLILVGLMGCNGTFGLNVTRGSGNIISDTRTVSGYHAVNLAGIGELNITQGESEGLTIQADDNLIPLITTTVENGVLTIGYDSKNGSISLSPSRSIQYNLQVKTLDSIRLAGAGNIKAPALKSDTLTITSSGAGNINLAQLDAKTCDLTINGAGNTILSGQVETQTAVLSGIGNYNASDLKTASTSVTVSGAGNATVWATDTLDVKISGVGGTSYYGSPKVTQSISGIGSVKSLGNK